MTGDIAANHWTGKKEFNERVVLHGLYSGGDWRVTCLQCTRHE